MAEVLKSASGVTESWIGRGSNALLRSAGRMDVALLTVMSIGLCTSGVLPFSVIAGQWPGVSLPAALTVGMLFCLIPAYIYAAIGAAVPRAGADYIFTSRVLNAPLAFIASWVFVLFSGMAAGGWVVDLIRTTVQSFLRMFSLILSLPNISDLSQSISQPGTAALIGTAVILIAFFTMLVPPRVFTRILWIGLILALLAWVIILVILGTASSRAFQEGWNQFIGPNSYMQVIPVARAAGLDTDAAPQPVALVGMAIGLWVFFGYFCSSFFAGEVKTPGRNLLTGSWLGLLMVWALITSAAYLLGRAAPAGWLSAISFLHQVDPASNLALPWLPFYAMVLAPSLPLVLFLFLAWLYATINLIQVMIAYMGRIMLAWAEDGLLPAGMDYVHPRYRSPLLTQLMAAVLIQVGLINALLGGFWGSQASLPFIAALVMIIPVTTMTVYPYLKPEWFETSPAFVRAHLGPLPFVSAFGGIALFSLLWYVASSLILRTGLGGVSRADGVALAIAIGLGLLWYWARRMSLRASGVQLAEKFKYLP